jgi:integration host factor subunit alpha|tara:strand:- start:461 stop:772 length:312 start_codon:yes stop_codon:yes gene_type:complete
MVTPKNKIKNITKKDITKNIFSIIGLPRVYSAKIINDIIKILISNLIINNKIKIKNFGTFLLQKKNERIGRNPKNKETHIISKRTIVSFKTAESLKGKINKDG